MARAIPIDIIKGISGKYGKDADFYFATNTSSDKIRISRLPKPRHRPPLPKNKSNSVLDSPHDMQQSPLGSTPTSPAN